MRSPFFSLLVFAPALVAQTTVTPTHFTSAEGTSSNRFPFGEVPSAPFRYQQVHDDIQGRPIPIRTMSFRRVGSPCGVPACTIPYPAYSITLDVWLSSATATSAAASTTFDLNHGQDKVQVVTNKAINFPATMHGSVPQPFVYVIVFDVPFAYLAQAPLCWEVQVTAGNNALQVYHSIGSGSVANPPLGNATFGAGCKASSQTSAMAVTQTSTMSWATGTGSLNVLGTFAPANGLVLTLVGIRNTNFGSIPLPFLVPLTSSAPSGSCHLYTDILMIVPTVANASGSSTTTIQVPATPDLHGARTFEQNLVLDPAANPFGVVLSDALNHNWVAPFTSFPACRIYLIGSLGPVGTATRNYGLVTQLSL